MIETRHEIAIVGLGYVGLCTSVAFAHRGFKTIGIDADEAKIAQISKGVSPLYEPHLARLLRSTTRKKLLEVSTEFSTTPEAEYVFVAVGTPKKEESGVIDLSNIKNAIQKVGRSIRDKTSYCVVVVKSTVTPGTTRHLVRPALETSSRKTIGRGLGLAFNPEFLSEGTAIADVLRPDKIVVGADDKMSARRVLTLYRKFHRSRLHRR